MNNNIFIHAKNGNREAIEFVIKTVEPFIFKQCRRMKLQEHDFEDLCQISYEAVIKAIPKLDEKHLDSAPSYLMKCIHNALKYEARRILAKPQDTSLDSEDKDGITHAEKLVAKENTESIFFRDENTSRVKEAFMTLTPEEKTVLSYFIQDPYGGIKRYSELYDTDYRKARYLKDKTLKKMKAYLEAHKDDDFEF